MRNMFPFYFSFLIIDGFYTLIYIKYSYLSFCHPYIVNHVTLSFTDFELEMVNTNCSHDAVEILDGNNVEAPVIGKQSNLHKYLF